MDEIFQKVDLQALVDAANKCAKGVRWKESVTQWVFNVHLNCAKLLNEIKSNKYKLSSYCVFHLIDNKKPRLIHSTKFRDRVVQRAICDNGLYEQITKPLIYETGACLENKGISFSVKLVEKHLKRFFFRKQRHSNSGYLIKLDISRFFDSTPHKVLKDVVNRYIKGDWTKERIFEIIDSFEDKRTQEEIKNDKFGKRGVGLGSQISQLLQVLVLNDIDHKIKHKYKVKYYNRYMDDMLFIVETKEHAKHVFEAVKNDLSEIGLSLNKKSHIGNLKNGFTFLNIYFRLTETGKVKRKLKKKTISRELKRSKKILKLFKENKISKFDLIQHFNSWVGSNMFKMTRNQLRKIKTSLK